MNDTDKQPVLDPAVRHQQTCIHCRLMQALDLGPNLSNPEYIQRLDALNKATADLIARSSVHHQEHLIEYSKHKLPGLVRYFHAMWQRRLAQFLALRSQDAAEKAVGMTTPEVITEVEGVNIEKEELAEAAAGMADDPLNLSAHIEESTRPEPTVEAPSTPVKPKRLFPLSRYH